MGKRDQLKLFLEPRSVAIIGASRTTGEGALNILQNLLEYGYTGRIYPVNPNADKILGVKAYPRIVDVPGTVDLAIIATARELAPQIVAGCVDKGIKAMIIIGQGFADADLEGRRLQSEVLRSSKEGGARIIGPNTFGVANAFNNFCSAFVPIQMEKVPVAVICQSGMFFASLPRLRLIGKGIDLGNASDIDFADALEYFEDDPDIKLIVLYVEGIREGRRFFEVAHRVSRKKPVLALKTGKTELAAKAAMSHSGSLVGRDEVYDAAFKQCGIIRVGDVNELEDASLALLHLPLMRGRRVGIITFTGAGGVMSVDACSKWGLEPAHVTPETRKQISKLFPSWLVVSNPVDIFPAILLSGHSFDKVFRIVLEALLTDRNVDAVVCITPAQSRWSWWDTSVAIQQLADAFPSKPIVSWLCSTDINEAIPKMEEGGKTVVFYSPERAIRALAHLRRYTRFLEG